MSRHYLPTPISGIDRTYQIVRLAVWLGGLSLLSYVTIALPLSYSAGQETTIHLVYGWVLTAQVHVFLPYAVIVILFILWQRERTSERQYPSAFALSVVFGGGIGQTAFSMFGLPAGGGFLVGFTMVFLALASAVLISRARSESQIEEAQRSRKPKCK